MPVKLNTSTIKARLGIEPNGRVQKYFQETCYRYMDKYVPRDDGNLRRDVDLSDSSKIVYESPYAHYQYEGKLYVMENGKGAYYSPDYGFWSKKPKHDSGKMMTEESYTTAGTGHHWDERMKSAEMDDVIDKLQKYIDRGAK